MRAVGGRRGETVAGAAAWPMSPHLAQEAGGHLREPRASAARQPRQRSLSRESVGAWPLRSVPAATSLGSLCPSGARAAAAHGCRKSEIKRLASGGANAGGAQQGRAPGAGGPCSDTGEAWACPGGVAGVRDQDAGCLSGLRALPRRGAGATAGNAASRLPLRPPLGAVPLCALCHRTEPGEAGGSEGLRGHGREPPLPPPARPSGDCPSRQRARESSCVRGRRWLLQRAARTRARRR